MKKWFKWSLIILAVIALLSLLVGAFDWAAAPVAKVIGKPVEAIKSIFRTIATVAIALIVVMAGIAAIAASPFLGVTLLAVGIVTLGITLWPLFSSSE
jgi:hypothetical protein